MRLTILLLLGILVATQGYSQVKKEIDSLQLKATLLMASVEAKYQRVNSMIDKVTNLPIQKLDQAQAKLVNLLEKKDKLLAVELAGHFKKYKALLEELQEKTGGPNGLTRNYFGRIDSLGTGLNFLSALPNSEWTNQLRGSMEKLNDLKGRYESLFRFEEQLRNQQAVIADKIGKWGGTKAFKQYQHRFNQLRSEVSAVKEELAYPDKLANRALGYLRMMPAFDAFYRKNSQYASLFNIQGGPNEGGDIDLKGLQTRATVEKMLQDKQLATSASGGNDVQQQLNQLTQQMDQLKLKGFDLQKGDLTELDTKKFQPVEGKRRTIFDHLELGFNVQTVRGRNLLPVTSDLGLSLGYKIKKWGIGGIGISYKMGWGTGFNNIEITHQGLGLRSFAEVKLKGQLYGVAGFEANYLSSFDKVSQLKDFEAWQQSGLAGISKKLMFGKKLKGNIQLLWDFLSYQQIPRSQPFLFRVGYTLK
jgi:hypothetical protein